MSRTVRSLILVVFFAISYGFNTYWNTAPIKPPSSAQKVEQSTAGDHSLTAVTAYIREHQALPDFYITKAAAARAGWVPSRGNLCDITTATVIGGDRFNDTEHLVPSAKGRVWYEADFDYHCGGRNAHRILYSNDGLIYVTNDHYKTVSLMQ